MDTAVQPRNAQPALVAELLKKLHDLRDDEQPRPQLAAWPERLEGWAAYPMCVAAAGFILLMAAAAVFLAGWVAVPKLSVGLLGLFVQLCALSSLALQTVGGAFGIWIEHRNGGRVLAGRAERDLRLATGMLTWNPSILDLADRWLEGEIKRIDSRLGMFFGGADKIALFALVGVGWAVVEEVQKSRLTAYPYLTAAGIAFLTGLALGGMVSRSSMQHFVYQRDLISLSKTLRGDPRISPLSTGSAS